MRVLQALAGEFRALPVAVTLIVLGLFFSTQSDVFLSSRNLSNLLIQSVVTGIVALGIIFVLLVAEIDLSVAATSGVAAVFMSALVVDQGYSPAAAVAAAVVVGLLIGLASGRWTTWFGVPSFVITLGVGLVLNGVQRILLPETGRYNLLNSGVERIAGTFIPPTWSWVVLLVGLAAYLLIQYTTYQGKRRAGVDSSLLTDVVLPVGGVAVIGAIAVMVLNGYRGLPVPVVIFIGLLAVAGYVTSETQFGLYLYAVGGNIEAARRVGIKIHRVKMAAFAIAGALAAFAGVLAASRILGVSVSTGGGIGGGRLLLESIAAAVIGGVSLFGGRGRISAALLGALVLGTVSNGLNLMGVADEIKLIVTGLLLIGAVSLDQTIERIGSPGARG
jgi:D-xylose transport system permease protein